MTSESDSPARKKEESRSNVGISKIEHVPLLLMSEISCQKEKNSISPCSCVNEVKVAQLKSPAVIGRKSIGTCEGEHTDQVNNQTFVVLQFDSREACD